MFALAGGGQRVRGPGRESSVPPNGLSIIYVTISGVSRLGCFAGFTDFCRHFGRARGPSSGKPADGIYHISHNSLLNSTL